MTTQAQAVAPPTPADFADFVRTHNRGNTWYADTIRYALHPGSAVRVPGFLVSFIMSHYQVSREVVHLALFQRARTAILPPLPRPHQRLQVGLILRHVPASEEGEPGYITELYQLPDWLLEFWDRCVSDPLPERVLFADAIGYVLTHAHESDGPAPQQSGG